MAQYTRRDVVKAAATGICVSGFPTIIPSWVLGAEAPSKMIQVAHIGFGRIGKSMDVPAQEPSANKDEKITSNDLDAKVQKITIGIDHEVQEVCSLEEALAALKLIKERGYSTHDVEEAYEELQRFAVRITKAQDGYGDQSEDRS